MAQYEVVFEMLQRANGWGYQFYKEGGSAAEVLTDLVGDKGQEDTEPLVIAIRNMHAFNTELVSVVARNLDRQREDVKRRSLFLSGTGGTATNVEHADDDDPDIVSAALQYRIFGATGGNRLLTLTGLPDNFVTALDRTAPVLQIGVDVRIQDLVEQLNDSNLQLRRRARPVPGTSTERVPIRYIESVTDTNDSYSRVVYSRATELVSGDLKVEFAGAQKNDILLAPYSGQFLVVDHGAVADTENQWYFDIQAQYIGPSAKIIPTLFFAQQVSYIYTTINDEGDFVKFSSRKRGPFRTTRGRSSGRSFRRKTM